MVPFLYDSIEGLHILHVAGCYTVLHTRCRHLFGEIEMIGMGHEKVSASKCKSMYGSRTVSACSYYLSLAIDCASIFCASTITVPILNQFGTFQTIARKMTLRWLSMTVFLTNFGFFWRSIFVVIHVPSRNWFYEWWYTNVVNQKKSYGKMLHRATSGVKTLSYLYVQSPKSRLKAVANTLCIGL